MYTKTTTINNITFNYSNKIVVVVGGSRGIGKEICKQFVLAGATVYCLSRTPLNTKGVTHIVCDISIEKDIDKAIAQLESIDFLINVAGTNLCEPIENITTTEWDRLMNTNLKSFFLISKKVIPLMKEKNSGRIVNVSSIAGRHKSVVSGVHYTSSKYGIVGLTKQLAHEVSRYNILVNCVCPSQTRTEMLEASMTEEQLHNLEKQIPVRRIATTVEQSLPVLFLCSDGASYISGATIDINGGQF